MTTARKLVTPVGGVYVCDEVIVSVIKKDPVVGAEVAIRSESRSIVAVPVTDADAVRVNAKST
jgi:hypothetical protein